MKQFTLEDLEYEGSQDKTHCWNLPDGQPYYWRQDWLHVAEDALGIHPKHPLNVPEGEEPTKEHAKQAIVDHANKEK